MNNWLKLEIADKQGIAANLKFLTPGRLINDLYHLLGGRAPEVLSPGNLSWLLYKIMGSEEFALLFPTIIAYFSRGNSGHEVKRLALAARVADLFDQYQIYRPKLIHDWNKADASDYVEPHHWQPWLWIKALNLTDGRLPDKTQTGNFILDALSNSENTKLLKTVLPSLHFFGISILTAYHLQIIHALSAKVDVHFYLLNPAPQVYWFNDKNKKQIAIWQAKNYQVQQHLTGNDLLTSLGKVIQATFGMMFENEEFLNANQEVGIVDVLPDTLLHKIQDDLYRAALKEERNALTLADLRDGSITINACYTPAREVEVLYNYLVRVVDKKLLKISARDVVVLVSNVDAYAPYIRAVFDNGPYAFPYHIADETFVGTDNVYAALHALLELNEDSFRAETILSLLDFSAIRNRVQINTTSRLREVVAEAAIRFGTTGSLEDDTYLVSWTYGIKRIMYGMCMTGEQEYGEGPEGFFPIDILEGNEMWEVVRFCNFVELLMNLLQRRRTHRTLHLWVEYVNELIQHFLQEPEEEGDEDINTIHDQLEQLSIAGGFMQEEVPYEVFLRSFTPGLQQASRTEMFSRGGITFCSLIPMRSIPFKIVAILGLNHDAFPRRDKKVSFDLMLVKPERGDRNVRDNDRHLFLETILSAKERLYLSYIGRNAKNNTALPPSAMIDELLDYCRNGLGDETEDLEDLLVSVHPLHGFSNKYAPHNDRWYSYLNASSGKMLQLIQSEEKSAIEPPDTLTVEQMIRMFKAPFKTYYSTVLGLRFDAPEDLLQEVEVFSLDRLQQWSVKNELLRQPSGNLTSFLDREKKRGNLPLGNVAEIVVGEMQKLVEPLQELWKQAVNEQQEDLVPVLLHLDGLKLEGQIANVHGGKLIAICWSKSEWKYLIGAYLNYLAAAAVGKADGLIYISGHSKRVFSAASLSQQEAIDRLTDLVGLYKEGLQAILPYDLSFIPKVKEVDQLTPEMFSALVKSILGLKARNYAEECILKEFADGFFDDPKLLPRFKKCWTLLITPIQQLFAGTGMFP